MPRPHRRSRREQWAQIGVVLLAAAIGVAAGLLGTPRSWEHRRPKAGTTTPTSAPNRVP